MKEQMKELVGLLRQSEVRRKEMEKELKVREQAVTALSTPPPVRLFFSSLFCVCIYIHPYYLCLDFSVATGKLSQTHC